MTIKRLPVCPFCGKDMTKSDDIMLPKALAQSLTDSIYLHIWECEGCGFVALWRGEPK